MMIERQSEVTSEDLRRYEQLAKRPLVSHHVKQVTLNGTPTDDELRLLLRFQNLQTIIFQEKTSQTMIWDVAGMRRTARNINSKGLLDTLRNNGLLIRSDLTPYAYPPLLPHKKGLS